MRRWSATLRFKYTPYVHQPDSMIAVCQFLTVGARDDLSSDKSYQFEDWLDPAGFVHLPM